MTEDLQNIPDEEAKKKPVNPPSEPPPSPTPLDPKVPTDVYPPGQKQA